LGEKTGPHTRIQGVILTLNAMHKKKLSEPEFLKKLHKSKVLGPQSADEYLRT
jgi:hypothetical protein